MTLCTLEREPGRFGLGIRTGPGILDCQLAERDFGSGAPVSVSGLFRGEGDAGALRKLVARASTSPRFARYFVPIEGAAFGPCVTEPGKILCVGLNYRQHAAETGNPIPAQPVLFNKFNNALNRHGGTIPVSRIKAEQFDYEAELVIVIGKTASGVDVSEAKSFIFGYAVGNDFTARDLQGRSSQWMLGKTCDGFGPIGPWLVTADQVDPDKLKIELKVNGQVRQSSNTSDMIFNCSQIVSYISGFITLHPGDIIFTGTPSGVIAGYPREKQVWLKPGDEVTTSIEALGELRFRLV